MVINLAAGLDTRPWRLVLPPKLRWVDVDLPAILQYKTNCMKDAQPRCRYEALPADLTDASSRRLLFARLGAEGTKVLVVTEGLLIYLTAEQVGALAQDLGHEDTFRWWLIDLASPRLLKIMNRYWGRALAQANAPFRFAPPEGTEFFRPFGWRESAYRSAMVEAQRLDREMRGMWLWRFLSRFYSAKRQEEMRHMSGVVLLEWVAPAGPGC